MANKNKKQISLTSAYDICAAHKLYRSEWDEKTNQSVYGKCTALHGHQYKLELTVEGIIPQETGMLINGFELDRIVHKAILSRLDHQYLNEDIPFFKKHMPTVEWIAVWIYQELKSLFPKGCQLKRIRLYETPTLYADYEG